MPLTTSYFAVAHKLVGTKISIARFNNPRLKGGVDEIMSSFAPSIELLMGYKNGKINWSQYTRRYTEEQREHYRENIGDFENLLNRAEDENIVLLCYERFEGPKTRCHRFLLYEILRKVSRAGEFEVDFVNEVSPLRKQDTT